MILEVTSRSVMTNTKGGNYHGNSRKKKASTLDHLQKRKRIQCSRICSQSSSQSWLESRRDRRVPRRSDQRGLRSLAERLHGSFRRQLKFCCHTIATGAWA